MPKHDIIIRTLSGNGTSTKPNPVSLLGAGGTTTDNSFYVTLGVDLPSGTYSLEVNSEVIGLMKAEFTID